MDIPNRVISAGYLKICWNDSLNSEKMVDGGNYGQKTNTEHQTLKLWYKQPASCWKEALPLGNGRVGAMIYGIPAPKQLTYRK